MASEKEIKGIVQPQSVLLCGADLLGKHINFAPANITHCCYRYSPICQFQGGDSFPLEEYKKSYRQFIRNNSVGISSCRYCPYGTYGEQGTELEVLEFTHVSINHFQKCQLNCIFCQERQKRKRVHDPEPYPLLPVFKDLYVKNILTANSMVHWGGGEITLYSHFKEDFSYLLEREIYQKVHSNCIIFAPLFVEALRAGKLEMLISIDSGTPETYRQVKGADRFFEVWGNIAKYCEADVHERITLKYIIMQHNMEEGDYSGFVSQCVKAGVKKIVISVDAHSYRNQKNSLLIRRYINGARRLYNLAVLSNLEIGFNFWNQEDIQCIITPPLPAALSA